MADYIRTIDIYMETMTGYTETMAGCIRTIDTYMETMTGYIRTMENLFLPPFVRTQTAAIRTQTAAI